MSEEEYETIEMQIYNDISDIDEEKIEKYKNSSEWNELDDLFKKITNETMEDDSSLTKLISYGEIVRVKFDYFLNNLEEGMVLTSEFIYLPLFMDMPYELAVNVVNDWKSDDEEKQKTAIEIILDYQRDRRIEDLIEIVKNARADDNYGVAWCNGRIT